MNPPPDLDVTPTVDRHTAAMYTPDRRPLSRRPRSGPTPPRVEAAVRRRVVLRARIAIDYPTHLDPADIRHWLATALVAEAATLDIDIDSIQLGLAAAPAWRTGGPADLRASVDHDGPQARGR